MYRKTETEMERWKIAKATRALLRLKHSLAADEEINAVLPDRIEAFDAAIQRGELLELKSVLEDI